MAEIINIEGVIKNFGNVSVLKGVNLSVEKGEILSIVGASGAGKSTLLQIIGTLLSPDGGRVEIDGTDISMMKSSELADFRNRHIGFVFQFHHLLPEFTALENVMMPALIAGKSFKEARDRAAGLLEEVSLGHRLAHKPSQMSGGEQQRTAIARALVNSPSVVLADEPSGNLDTRTKEDIHSLFFRLRERFGQTILIVTHDTSLASVCDRALEMRDGVFI